jgi:hypothetical protein
MENREERQCQCGYPVTFLWIHDAHDENPTNQFVFIENGVPVTGDICPNCKRQLTKENTTLLNTHEPSSL